MKLEKIARREASELTRRQIVAVAREQFAAAGLAFTSLQTIADAVGISRPGLLKHFPSKTVLVDAVAERFTDDVAHAAGTAASLRTAADRWSAHVSDYPAMCAILLHEAMTAEGARRRELARHHERVLRGWAESDTDVPVLTRVDTPLRASVLTAMWEGFHVMRSYIDDADSALIWATTDTMARAHVPAATTMVEALRLESVLSDDPGYASGRRRRDLIVIDSAALFARQGFHGTTMREIAERVGVAPSALLYHFPDKAALLAEVLRRRDVEMVERRGGEILDPVLELESIGAEAHRDERAEHGLIALYSVLSTEAAVGHHPAREYLRDRFVRTVAYFENVIARAAAELDLRVDPRRESLLLVALWDGLQYQRLLSEGLPPTDVPATLDAYINGLLRAG